VEPCQPGCHPGKREPSRFQTIPFGSAFAVGQAVARARWRRCFAFSLALRLFARIVLLDLAVFSTWGSDLDGIGPFLSGILIAGHRLSARIAMPITGNAFRSRSRSALRISSATAGGSGATHCVRQPQPRLHQPIIECVEHEPEEPRQ
jgi:hypothetical protein